MQSGNEASQPRLQARIVYLLRQVAGFYLLLKTNILDRKLAPVELKREGPQYLKELDQDITYLTRMHESAMTRAIRYKENTYSTVDDKIDSLRFFITELEAIPTDRFSSATARVVAAEHTQIKDLRVVELKNVIAELEQTRNLPPPKPISNFEKYCIFITGLCGGLLNQYTPDNISRVLKETKMLAEIGIKEYPKIPYTFTPIEAIAHLNEIKKHISEIDKLLEINKMLIKTENEDYELALGEIEQVRRSIESDINIQNITAAELLASKTSLNTFVELIEKLSLEIDQNNTKLKPTLVKALALLQKIHQDIYNNIKPSWTNLNNEFLTILKSGRDENEQKFNAFLFSSKTTLPQILKDVRATIQAHLFIQNNKSNEEAIRAYIAQTHQILTELDEKSETKIQALNSLLAILSEIYPYFEKGLPIDWITLRTRVEDTLREKLNFEVKDLSLSKPVQAHFRKVLDFININYEREENNRNFEMLPNSPGFKF